MAQVLIGSVSAVDMEMRLTAQCWILLAAFRAVIVVMILDAKLENSFRRLGYAANPVHNHAVVTGMQRERYVSIKKLMPTVVLQGAPVWHSGKTSVSSFLSHQSRCPPGLAISGVSYKDLGGP